MPESVLPPERSKKMAPPLAWLLVFGLIQATKVMVLVCKIMGVKLM